MDRDNLYLHFPNDHVEAYKNALNKALCFLLCVGAGCGERVGDDGRVYDTRHMPLSRALPWNRPLPIEIVQEIMDNVFDHSRVDMFGLHHDLRCTYERDTKTLKIPVPFGGSICPTYYEYNQSVSIRNYWFHGKMHGPAEIVSKPSACMIRALPGLEHGCYVRCNYHMDKAHGPIYMKTPAMELQGDIHIGVARGIYTVAFNHNPENRQFLADKNRFLVSEMNIDCVELHYHTEHDDDGGGYTVLVQRNYSQVCNPQCRCHIFGMGYITSTFLGGESGSIVDMTKEVRIKGEMRQVFLDLNRRYPNVNLQSARSCTLKSWHISIHEKETVTLDLFFTEHLQCGIVPDLRGRVRTLLNVCNNCKPHFFNHNIRQCYYSVEQNGNHSSTSLFYERRCPDLNIRHYKTNQNYSFGKLEKPPAYYDPNDRGSTKIFQCGSLKNVLTSLVILECIIMSIMFVFVIPVCIYVDNL